MGVPGPQYAVGLSRIERRGESEDEFAASIFVYPAAVCVANGSVGL
jgi:hypothetical protein